MLPMREILLAFMAHAWMYGLCTPNNLIPIIVATMFGKRTITLGLNTLIEVNQVGNIKGTTAGLKNINQSLMLPRTFIVSLIFTLQLRWSLQTSTK